MWFTGKVLVSPVSTDVRLYSLMRCQMNGTDILTSIWLNFWVYFLKVFLLWKKGYNLLIPYIFNQGIHMEMITCPGPGLWFEYKWQLWVILIFYMLHDSLQQSVLMMPMCLFYIVFIGSKTIKKDRLCRDGKFLSQTWQKFLKKNSV